MPLFLPIFRRFPTTFGIFSKILKKISEGQTKVSSHFPKISKAYQRFSKKITEDRQRFPRRIQWCFDHTKTHLSAILRDSLCNHACSNSKYNRPFAAKPSRDLLFIKLWATTLRMPEMEKACRKHQNGQVWSPWH